MKYNKMLGLLKNQVLGISELLSKSNGHLNFNFSEPWCLFCKMEVIIPPSFRGILTKIFVSVCEALRYSGDKNCKKSP